MKPCRCPECGHVAVTATAANVWRCSDCTFVGGYASLFEERPAKDTLRVYEGKLERDSWERDQRAYIVMADGSLPTWHDWTRGLVGKRVRLTIEVLPEADDRSANHE